MKNTPFRPDSFDFVPKDFYQQQEESAAKTGLFKDSLLRLFKNKGFAVGAVILILVILLAAVGPIISPYGTNEQMVDFANAPPRIPLLAEIGIADGTRLLYNRRVESLSDPSLYPKGSIVKIVETFQNAGVEMCHVQVDYYAMAGIPDNVNFWFGTDYLGRDLFARLCKGAQISLFVALASVALSLGLGVVYGALAGFYGGKIDIIMMRFAELVGAFPQSIIATLLVLFFGTGIKAIILALALRGWTSTAKLVRGQFLRFKNREYVLSAKTMGAKDKRLIFLHILPNAVGPVITRATAEIPGAIFSEAFLAFIGLGVQAPTPSMGVLLADGQRTLMAYPYQTVVPAVLISLIMISFNLLGNGLRDSLDPTQRGGNKKG